MRLKGRKILVGITGGIAAYKAAILVRNLIREGAAVQVLMTEFAKKFITPLTMATLSKNPILVDFFDPENGTWNSHVDLGTWADALVIAPATANTMGKMAHGIADNLLITTYLSARCPVMIAPAMDLDMFLHPTTKRNLEILKNDGVTIIEPGTGELASGLDGKGRMEEPDVIVDRLVELLNPAESLNLINKKVLITAGPTYELIDPVRFIGNFSSGKMGFAIAEECKNRGANVTVIAGPVSIPYPDGVEVIPVTSAKEMYENTSANFDKSDITILAAAVADYTTKEKSKEKIKSSDNELILRLEATVDIAFELGKRKKENQFLAGFALETNNELQNASEKLRKKNFDCIVLNSMNDENATFNYDTNKITIVDNDGTCTEYELKAKSSVAKDIINYIAKKFKPYA